MTTSHLILHYSGIYDMICITEELCNEQAATKTVSKIFKDIRMLSEFPESAPLLSAIVNFDTNYRYLVCGKYVAFYRLEENELFL